MFVLAFNFFRQFFFSFPDLYFSDDVMYTPLADHGPVGPWADEGIKAETFLLTLSLLFFSFCL